MDLVCAKLRGLVRFPGSTSLSWRAAVAVAGGVALALAFPYPGWSSLAWIAPGLLLSSTLGRQGWSSFRLGWLGGFAHSLVSLRWLLEIPFPAGAIAGWLALSAYMALYVGLWTWIGSRILPRRSPTRTTGFTWLTRARWRRPSPFGTTHAAPPPGPSQPAAEAQPASTDHAPAAALPPHAPATDFESLVQLPWASRCLWAVGCALAWVTIEMLSAHVLSGFPWNPLGASQYRAIPLIQVAALTGVPGISFLVVWLSVALLLGGLRLGFRVARPALPAWRGQAGGNAAAGTSANRRFATLRLALLTDLGLPLLAVVATALWGLQRVYRAPALPRQLDLALVQPSIPQTLMWDASESTNRFNRLMDLSALALATRPDLLVWPEASLPELTETDFEALTRLIATHKAWLVFGADDYEARPEGGHYAFNSAFLFSPEGRYVETYRKQRLVIFGEYVPLESWLPLVKRLTPIEGSFTPGPKPVAYRLTNPKAEFSVLICFEDVFARGARRHVGPATDFLLNLTNDGWFGEGPAQWQHAAHAAFRAVENGVPLVRCTNNGLTCWIDERGRFRDTLGEPDGDLHAAGFLHIRLPLPAEGEPWPATWFRVHGDVFGWGCCGLTAVMLALGLMNRRKASNR